MELGAYWKVDGEVVERVTFDLGFVADALQVVFE